MADSARSIITFEAAGQRRCVRVTFALLDSLEVVLDGGLRKLVLELYSETPRTGLVARCAAELLRHAEPPLEGITPEDAVAEAGAMAWLVDPDHPKRWGVLVRFAQLALYGPDVLADALKDEPADKDDSGKGTGSKKK